MLLHGSMMATVAILAFWIVYQGEEVNLARAQNSHFLCLFIFANLVFARLSERALHNASHGAFLKP